MESKLLKNKIHLMVDGKPKLVMRKITKKINDTYTTNPYFYNPFNKKYDIPVDSPPKILDAHDNKDVKTVSRF